MESAHTAARTPRSLLPMFLTAVLLVRCLHLAMLGTTLTGMNPKMAVLAKDWSRYGFGASFIDVPPGPVLLLAWPSTVLNVPPGDLVPAAILIGHLLLALGFWFWLRSLEPTPELEATSLALFVFLPCNNSYIGFDNFPVVFAAAAFFGTTGIWQRSFDRPFGRLSWAALFGLAALIPPFRGDYLVFLPVYVAVVLCGRRVAKAVFGRRIWAATAVMLAGLAVGTCSVMLFSYFDSGEFRLAPKQYTCWTFLDGTPPAWQRTGDRSETDRVASGIAKFGDPADYDYSLARMICHNPGPTVQKFILNLPSWVFELARRHVVVPLPLAVLAALGAWGMCRIRTIVGTEMRWAPVVATILMTLPLAALIVSARYMIPAFGAICVLAAAGLLVVVDRFHRRLSRHVTKRALWWVGVTFACVGLELLLLRGGGLLRDAVDVRPVARFLDHRLGEKAGEPIVLDPHSPGIDAACRVTICNRRLQRAMGRSMYGFEPYDPLAAAMSPDARRLGVRTVVHWSHGNGDTPTYRARIEQWETAGFRLIQQHVLGSANSPRFAVAVLIRESER